LHFVQMSAGTPCSQSFGASALAAFAGSAPVGGCAADLGVAAG
jgi:hypothetical protein